MQSLTEHLDDVGESYWEHFRHAIGFSGRMVLGGLACGVHALLPFLCEKTGSDCIRALHDRMVMNRKNLSQRSHREDPLAQSEAAGGMRPAR